MSGSIPVLDDYSDYYDWKEDFLIYAATKGFNGFYDMTLDIPEMPDPNDYGLAPPEKDPNLDPAAKAAAKKKRQGRATLDPTDVASLIQANIQSASETSAGTNYANNLALFKYQKSQADDFLQKCAKAQALLAIAAGPMLRSQVSTQDNPPYAMAWLDSQRALTDDRALELATIRLERAHVSRFDTVQSYISEVLTTQKRIQQFGGSCTDQDVINKLVRGLDKAPLFDSFVDSWRAFRNLTATAGQNAVQPTVSDLTAQLLTYESDKAGRRSNQISFQTYMEKQSKPQPRRIEYNRTRGDRTSYSSPRQNFRPTREIICDACGKIGHNANTCWIAHPELAPKRSSQNGAGYGRRDNGNDTEHVHPERRLQIENRKPSGMGAIAFLNEEDFVRGLKAARDSPAEPNRKQNQSKNSAAAGQTYKALSKPTSMAAVSTTNDDAFFKELLRKARHNKGKEQHVNNCPHSTSNYHLPHTDPADLSQALRGSVGRERLEVNEGLSIEGELVNRRSDTPMRGTVQPVARVSCDSAVNVALKESTFVFTCLPNGSQMKPICLAASINPVEKNDWILDSGANIYMCNDERWFTELHEFHTEINTAGVDKIKIVGGGTVCLSLIDADGDLFKLNLSDVAFSPTSRCNLLSQSRLANAGIRGEWLGKSCKLIHPNGSEIGSTSLENGLYHVRLGETPFPSEPRVHTYIAAAVDFEHPVWKEHRRLGHMSLQKMVDLSKRSTGMRVSAEDIKTVMGSLCPICQTTAAVVRIPKDPARRRYKKRGQLVHVDMWGPYPIPGWDGTTCVVIATDDATRKTSSLPIKRPEDAPEALRLHHKEQGTEGFPILRYRTDNQFSKGPWKKYCTKHGVENEPTAPYAHYQVGVAERTNRTLREKASAIVQETTINGQISRIIEENCSEQLRNTNMPEELWIEAFRYATHLKNKTPTKVLKDNRTPYEAWTKQQPDITREITWGTRVFATSTPEERRGYRGTKKIHDPRGWIGYFVGIENNSTYRIWDPDYKLVRLIPQVRFVDGDGTDDKHATNAISARVNIPEDLTQEESATEPDSPEEGPVDVDESSDPSDDERRPEMKTTGTKSSYFQQNTPAAMMAEGRLHNPDTEEESDSPRQTRQPKRANPLQSISQAIDDYGSDLMGLSPTDDTHSDEASEAYSSAEDNTTTAPGRPSAPTANLGDNPTL